MTFTKEQPKSGETILHCGHFERRHLHWFQSTELICFVRPDGTRGQAQWIAACEPCFVEHGDQVARFVRGDEIWQEDEPVIVEPAKS